MNKQIYESKYGLESNSMKVAEKHFQICFHVPNTFL